MLENVIIGLLTTVACLTIQCFLVAILVYTHLGVMNKETIDQLRLAGFTFILVRIMLVMLLGNLLQVVIWAELFRVKGEFTDFATAFYHSLVNFATLGYGDIVMSEQRRLLGALEAVNGSLMLGLTTAFLFAVLGFLTRRKLRDRLKLED